MVERRQQWQRLGGSAGREWRHWAKEWTGAGTVRGAESAQQLNARLICGGRAGSDEAPAERGSAGRVKAMDGRQWSHWTGGGLFGRLNIEPRMARDLLDGLRVRFSLGA